MVEKSPSWKWTTMKITTTIFLLINFQGLATQTTSSKIPPISSFPTTNVSLFSPWFELKREHFFLVAPTIAFDNYEFQMSIEGKPCLNDITLNKVVRIERGNKFPIISFHVSISGKEYQYLIRRASRNSIHIRCRKERDCRAGLRSGWKSPLFLTAFGIIFST